MFGALKISLSNITSAFLETVQLEISQLVEKLIEKLLMFFYMRKKLGTNVFVQDRLVKGKKSFFEPICKVKLKTGSEKKKVLKSL